MTYHNLSKYIKLRLRDFRVDLLHGICENSIMGKNVTISLEEDLLVYARSLANAQAKSLSKFIADYFRDLKSSEDQTLISLERYKSRKKLFDSKGLRTWKREDLYER